MNKNMLIGVAVGIGIVWGLKNIPGVSGAAAPVLAKVGL